GGRRVDVEDVDGALAGFALRARAVDVAAPDGRFRFQGLDGNVRLVSTGSADSELRWQSAAIGAIPFGPARLPSSSRAGELHLREGVGITMLDGRLDIPALRLRPPGGKGPLLVEAALGVESLDMATLATALGLPAFPGTLTGQIPSARYVGDRLDFAGGIV